MADNCQPTKLHTTEEIDTMRSPNQGEHIASIESIYRFISVAYPALSI